MIINLLFHPIHLCLGSQADDEQLLVSPESLDFKHFAGTLMSMQSAWIAGVIATWMDWDDMSKFQYFLICLQELVKGTHMFWNKHGFLTGWNNNIH